MVVPRLTNEMLAYYETLSWREFLTSKPFLLTNVSHAFDEKNIAFSLQVLWIVSRT